ncbi:Septum site-determining protein MinD [hydrothermal vent metagenome]|uniref:Septum site-determining protein MinD n=1 Tax=hydrothermal vent metagenome TaxID=652676 RepID=A0A3B0TS77_9ZZZZ
MNSPVTNLKPQSSRPQTETGDELRPVKGVNSILLVASGKGGVGKSTVSVNLACALAKTGQKVGLLDADLYGPSIQRMMGTTDELIQDERGFATPGRTHGVWSLSMGNLAPPEAPLTWKGALVAQALLQMFHEVNWPDLDVLVVDLPPGTGDIQLTILEQIPISGAIVVTTPQELAVADAERAIVMFHDLGLPVFGLVENMNAYICPCCGQPQDLYPSGTAPRLARKRHINMLTGIPLDPSAQEFADNGAPLVLSSPDSLAAKSLFKLTKEVSAALKREQKAQILRTKDLGNPDAEQFWDNLLSGDQQP